MIMYYSDLYTEWQKEVLNNSKYFEVFRGVGKLAKRTEYFGTDGEDWKVRLWEQLHSNKPYKAFKLQERLS